MIKAFAPRMPRGCSWVWLSIVLLGSVPGAVRAQQPSTKPATPAKADTAKEKEKAAAEEPAAKAKDAKGDEKGGPAEAEGEKTLPFELFQDPNAKAALEGKFQALRAPNLRTPEIKQVRDMAKGVGQVDREVISRYVGKMAADLTNPAFIRGVLNQPAPAAGKGAAPPIGKAFKEASANLLDPIEDARKGNNEAFLRTYTQELVRVLPAVLKNHLLARIEAIIALGQTGSPDALNIFVEQINDPNQTVWVKLWAAKGITNIAQTSAGNRVDATLGGRASVPAKALANFLNQQKDAPWPAQMRALEALGALRLASTPEAQAKVEMADAALRLLADPQARPAVRAQAAWALGMMRVSGAAGRFNYSLIAYYVGEVAADLGEKIAATYAENMTQVEYWTALLAYQIYPALSGQDGVRESGLLKMPGVGGNLAFIRQVADLVRPVVRTSVDLVLKTPRGQQAQVAKDLSDRVGQLRAFLDKNPPAENSLVPGGNAFPIKAQVAGAPAGDARVAGARPSGR